MYGSDDNLSFLPISNANYLPLNWLGKYPIPNFLSQLSNNSCYWAIWCWHTNKSQWIKHLQNVVCEKLGYHIFAKKVMSISWWGGILNSILMCIMSPTTKSRSGFAAAGQCSNTESSPRADHIWTPPLQLVSHLHSHVGLPIKEVWPHNFIHMHKFWRCKQLYSTICGLWIGCEYT